MEEASQQQQQPTRNEILVETSTINDVSPRTTVRTNWLRYSWSQISGATKALLIISLTIAIIQIATTVTILAIGSQRGLSCEKPLQLYLIVFVVRVGISSPLSIYQHLFVPRNRGRGRRNRDGVGAERRRRRRGGRSSRNRSNNNSGATLPTEETQAAEVPTATTTTANTNTMVARTLATNDTSNNNSGDTQPAEQGQGGPSTLISGWVDRLRSLLDLFAILWFIVGNYLVFSPSTCSVNAAPYYYTVLTWVLFGYAILIIPLLACASVIFCLPVILVALRTFNINVSNVMVGGTKEEIAKIPVFKYKAPPSLNEPSSSSSTNDLEQQGQQQAEIIPKTESSTSRAPTAKKSNYIRRFMKRHQKQESNKSSTTPTPETINQYLTIPNAEDALCSICLSEYENDEIICKLWCQHHFHHECCAEWLALNSKCPLCKRDFRGKNYIDPNSSEDDEEGEEEEEDSDLDEEERV